MAFLEPKLNLKVQQKQVLTPGLVQMVSLLTLNKLELTEMIQQELVQNPVLEEGTEIVENTEEAHQRDAEGVQSKVLRTQHASEIDLENVAKACGEKDSGEVDPRLARDVSDLRAKLRGRLGSSGLIVSGGIVHESDLAPNGDVSDDRRGRRPSG